MSTSLQSAKDKLSRVDQSPYPTEDLPKDRSDPMWGEIRDEYGLSLPELGALENFACPIADDIAYVVSIVVRAAKQCQGARGNVYKLLQKHQGHYSESEGVQITYVGQALRAKCYFVSYELANNFVNDLQEWDTHKELVNLHGIEFDSYTPVAEAQRLAKIHPAAVSTARLGIAILFPRSASLISLFRATHNGG